MEDRPQSIWRNTIILFGSATLGILLCLFALGVSIDMVCVRDANDMIPIYPNSTLISQSYTMFRPFGLGDTVVVLETDDAERDVLEWYGDIRTQNMTSYQSLAEMRFSVGPRADGAGARIVLTSDCAWR